MLSEKMLLDDGAKEFVLEKKKFITKVVALNLKLI